MKPTIITWIGLVVIMSADQGRANLYLVNATNHTLDKCYDFPTSFSTKVPSEGLWGHHVFSEPPDGCGPLVSPPSEKTWFAVVFHTHKCRNIDRALHAEAAGFKALIICLNDSEATSNDVEKSEIVTKVKIPATEVGLFCIPALVHYEKDLNTYTVLYDSNSGNMWLLLVVGGSGILLVILCSGLMAWLIHFCCRRKKTIGLLSRWKLNRLKVHTYQSGDSFEVCAICFEDYHIGDKLRILPCVHAFHCRCVDVWLTENRKTCPLCNIAADTRQRHEGRGNSRINENDDERTPLLSDDPPPDDRTDDGHENHSQNASVNDPLPGVIVRHPRDEIVEVHEEPALRDDRFRNYGSISAPAPDVLTKLERNDDSSLVDHSPSSFLSQNSAESNRSSSTEFRCGSPRDAETNRGFEASSAKEGETSKADSVKEENNHEYA